jgi:tetratricopeptide (TPR) repeat protein
LNGIDPLSPLLGRYRELEDALARAHDTAESARLGTAAAELLDTLKQLEGRLAELREMLRQLMDRHGILPGLPAGAVGLPPAVAERQSELGGGHLAKGWKLLHSGDHDGAVALLKEALDLAPDDPGVLSSLGWAQTISQQYDDALATYHQLLVVRPEDTLARVNLGYICLRKGIYGEAIGHLSKAIRCSTDQGTGIYGRYYLGLVYLAREMYDDAESFLHEVVELDPTMSEASFQLGRTRYLAGRKADALSAWKDGAATPQGGFWASRCAEAARSAESGVQPLLD